ncbi:hypothetical protein [Terrisporobacter sp.]
MKKYNKYYNYEDISRILEGTVELIKVAEQFRIDHMEYETRSDSSLTYYRVFIQHKDTYWEVEVSEKNTSYCDCYKVDDDYIIEYSNSYIF